MSLLLNLLRNLFFSDTSITTPSRRRDAVLPTRLWSHLICHLAENRYHVIRATPRMILAYDLFVDWYNAYCQPAALNKLPASYPYQLLSPPLIKITSSLYLRRARANLRALSAAADGGLGSLKAPIATRIPLFVSAQQP